ncbi:uncharacterized protein LOC122232616 [Panthera tigris]|uniref:uncharacterized protein LOC122232616 n=1 Tax=Panthera tigris TaxID=9694 RepID=UPI001C6FA092|nr:uncharacterized protein LOC122232616 [Panthera tigris]
MRPGKAGSPHCRLLLGKRLGKRAVHTAGSSWESGQSTLQAPPGKAAGKAGSPHCRLPLGKRLGKQAVHTAGSSWESSWESRQSTLQAPPGKAGSPHCRLLLGKRAVHTAGSSWESGQSTLQAPPGKAGSPHCRLLLGKREQGDGVHSAHSLEDTPATPRWSLGRCGQRQGPRGGGPAGHKLPARGRTGRLVTLPHTPPWRPGVASLAKWSRHWCDVPAAAARRPQKRCLLSFGGHTGPWWVLSPCVPGDVLWRQREWRVHRVVRGRKQWGLEKVEQPREPTARGASLVGLDAGRPGGEQSPRLGLHPGRKDTFRFWTLPVHLAQSRARKAAAPHGWGLHS